MTPFRRRTPTYKTLVLWYLLVLLLDLLTLFNTSCP